MEKENAKHFDCSLLVVAAIAFLFFWFGQSWATKHQPTETIKTDTLVVVRWDTVTIEKPTEIVRYVVRRDTIHATDTAIKIIFDSVSGGSAAIIPIESVIYKDSTENAKYTAYLSGFRAALDSIEINCRNTETIITKIECEKARRLGVGIQLGVGVSAQGLAVPYLGVGVQYRLW